MRDDKITTRVVLAGFFGFNIFIFTLHNNGDGPTFVSVETMLNRDQGGRQAKTYSRTVAVLLCGVRTSGSKNTVSATWPFKGRLLAPSGSQDFSQS